ncbi:hypothetical protein ELBI_66 [Anabaena phage Elbi]|nr:hypothetical protein ELBI_66 [Anabaena phage Elbi]
MYYKAEYEKPVLNYPTGTAIAFFADNNTKAIEKLLNMVCKPFPTTVKVYYLINVSTGETLLKDQTYIFGGNNNV